MSDGIAAASADDGINVMGTFVTGACEGSTEGCNDGVSEGSDVGSTVSIVGS